MLCALSTPAAAHEFWLRAQPPSIAPAGTTRLSLNVGEYFTGDVIAFSTQYVAALRHHSLGATQDLLSKVATTPTIGEFPIRLEKAGTHLFAYDSHPNRITLGAEKFHAYLHEEGLDPIIAQREQAGTAATPARERYRRYVKTLVEVGNKPDATYATRTGQRLELVPAVNPTTAGAGDTLPFTLLFEQKPLADALVKAAHLREGQSVTIRARTDGSGRVAFNLPYPGAWMVSVVHMIPASDPAEDDWDSLWGNLTFSLGAKAAAAKTRSAGSRAAAPTAASRPR